MCAASSLLFTCLGIFSYLANAQAPTHTVAVLPDGRVCPEPAIVTVSVIPVYISTYVPGPTEINIYGDGNVIYINGPTTIITSTVITTTIYPTATLTVSPSITGLPGSGGVTSGSSTSVSSTGSTSSVSSTSGSGSTSISTSSSGSGSTSSLPSTSSTSVTSSTGPPVTSTSTPPNTFGVTLVYVEPTATLGQGLPTGEVTSLPPGSGPVILGFAGRIANKIRRQASANPSATVAGYLQGDAAAGGGCGYAARWGLEDGMLTRGNASVGKKRGALFAPIEPSDTPTEVNVTFYFNNGILGWNTTDVGPASFFNCGGRAYAGFPSAPFSNCTAFTVGGVDADVCPVDVATVIPPSSTPMPSSQSSTSVPASTTASTSTSSTSSSSATSSTSTFTSSSSSTNSTSTSSTSSSTSSISSSASSTTSTSIPSTISSSSTSSSTTSSSIETSSTSTGPSSTSTSTSSSTTVTTPTTTTTSTISSSSSTSSSSSSTSSSSTSGSSSSSSAPTTTTTTTTTTGTEPTTTTTTTTTTPSTSDSSSTTVTTTTTTTTGTTSTEPTTMTTTTTTGTEPITTTTTTTTTGTEPTTTTTTTTTTGTEPTTTTTTTTTPTTTTTTTTTTPTTTTTTTTMTTSEAVVATQALCAGVDIPSTPQGVPVLGAYNYQAVRIGGAVFEVACYVDTEGERLEANIPGQSLEECAESCAAYNINNPGTDEPCVGAGFFGGLCFRRSSYGIPTPDMGLRSVRLISADYGHPAINDQMYPLPKIATSTLCVGPSSTAFAYQTVFPQRMYSFVDQYTPYPNKYEVECQRRPIGGTLGSDQWLPSFQQAGYSITHMEDCLRYCQWSNERQDNSCHAFSFDSAASDPCSIYSAVAGFEDSPGLNGGRFMNVAVGYANATDRP